MRNYLSLLNQIIEKIEDVPIMFLSAEVRYECNFKMKCFIDNLAVIVVGDEKLKKDVANLKNIKLSNYKGELVFSSFLIDILKVLDSNEDVLYKEVSLKLEKIKKRAQNHFVFIKKIKQEKKGLIKDNILEHDKSIFIKECEFYALDYFLASYKLLSELKDIEKFSMCIFERVGKMPSLKDDAMSDDMVNKIIYSIFDDKIRTKMLVDFYGYKKIYLRLEEVKDENVMNNIVENLRKYCCSILQFYINFNIIKIENFIYSPYGEIEILSLKKMIC